MNEENLIFLISQPRSGSTLLQALLSNNEKISTSNEPWLLLPFLGYDTNLVKAKYNSNFARKAIGNLNDNYNDTVSINLKDFLLKTYSSFMNENDVFFLDKTPRYYEIIDKIIDFFPQSKIIILKRNPFAVLNSKIEKAKVFYDISSTFINGKRDIIDAPFLIQKAIEKYGDRDNTYILKYEDLIVNSEKEIHDIYKWLEIPFNMSILDFSKNKKITGKMGDQKINETNVIDSINLEKWKLNCKKGFWKFFYYSYSSFLGELFLNEYGYDGLHKKRKKKSIINLYIKAYDYQNCNTLKKHFKSKLSYILISNLLKLNSNKFLVSKGK